MKYLHTMVRVTDLDASLAFYCDKLGLIEVKRKRVTSRPSLNSPGTGTRRNTRAAGISATLPIW
jgi:catechol 2,3-dioxygenase-like lactoylglutathione lyase family enzyme